jgi:Ca2+-transporting ATPase
MINETKAISGLTNAVAQMRLKQEGLNQLPHLERRSFLRILGEIIREPMFILLLAGAFIYLVLGDLGEAIILLIFSCISLGITLIQEFRSEKLLDSLRDLSAPRARVIRDGVPLYIASGEVVRGDLLLVSEGDRVAADAQLIDAHDLMLDESLLTGESIAVSKEPDQNPYDGLVKPHEDRTTIYSGTLVIKGSAQAIVFATGLRTELGKIGGSLATINTEHPQLRKQIRSLVNYSALAGLLVATWAILLHGMFRGSWLEALLAGIAIGMSMIPEEFPLVIAVFMAMGAWHISRIGVLTRRVAAIETLGAITVLCTDKTGTLTVNSMSVVTLVNDEGCWEKNAGMLAPEISASLRVGAMASEKIPTDPMDIAIHKLAEVSGTGGVAEQGLLHSLDLRPDVLAIVNIYASERPSTVTIYTKGAFEAITLLCKLAPEKIINLSREVEGLGARGIRVLALARLVDTNWNGEQHFREHLHSYNFEYCGFIGFADPLRDEVPAAISECQSAGVRIAMITGDHPTTAVAIAHQAGIQSVNCLTGDDIDAANDEIFAQMVKRISIFARVRPHQKLRIVNMLKSQGEIVAMTGDGVNDAPAIKASHVGIAMGKRGTEVAREAAALVLLTDNFASIVKAIQLGRRIYDNLRKAIEYIIAVHLPIAGLALAPLLLDLPLMLTPIHIAFLQMIIDPTCAIVFEAEPAENNVMRRPPRDPQSSIIRPTRMLWGIIQGAGVLSILILTLVMGSKVGIVENELRALVFTQLVIMNIGLIFINRTFQTSLQSALSFSNRVLWTLVLVVIALLMLSLTWTPLQSLFRFGTIHSTNLIPCITLSVLVILILGLVKKYAFNTYLAAQESRSI